MFMASRILQAALVTLAVASCGGNSYQDLRPEDSAVLRVENNNSRDMRVYLRPAGGGARFRIGTANGLGTTRLKIPRTMVTGATQITFEIVPIGGGGSSFSEQITVNPGEEIVLQIQP